MVYNKVSPKSLMHSWEGLLGKVIELQDSRAELMLGCEFCLEEAGH